MAIAASVTREEPIPIHATFPSVNNLHRTVPVIPSEWLKEVNLRTTLGAINVAHIVSAIARFTSR